MTVQPQQALLKPAQRSTITPHITLNHTMPATRNERSTPAARTLDLVLARPAPKEEKATEPKLSVPIFCHRCGDDIEPTKSKRVMKVGLLLRPLTPPQCCALLWARPLLINAALLLADSSESMNFSPSRSIRRAFIMCSYILGPIVNGLEILAFEDEYGHDIDKDMLLGEVVKGLRGTRAFYATIR